MPKYPSNQFGYQKSTKDLIDASGQATPLYARVLDDPEQLQRLRDFGADMVEWAARFGESPPLLAIIGSSTDHDELSDVFSYVEKELQEIVPRRSPLEPLKSANQWQSHLSGLIEVVPHIADLILGTFTREPDGTVNDDLGDDATSSSPSWRCADIESEYIVKARVPSVYDLLERTNSPGWGFVSSRGGFMAKHRLAARAFHAKTQEQQRPLVDPCRNAAQNLRKRFRDPKASGNIPDVRQAVAGHGGEQERRAAEEFEHALEEFVGDASAYSEGSWFDVNLIASAQRLVVAHEAWSETCLPLIHGPRSHSRSHAQRSQLQAVRKKTRGWVADATQVALLASGHTRRTRILQTIESLGLIGEEIITCLDKVSESPLSERQPGMAAKVMRELDSLLVSQRRLHGWRSRLGPNVKRGGRLIQVLQTEDPAIDREWAKSEIALIMRREGLLNRSGASGEEPPTRSELDDVRDLLALMQSAGLVFLVPPRLLASDGVEGMIPSRSGGGHPEDLRLFNPLGVTLLAAPAGKAAPAAKPVRRRASKRSKGVKKSTPRRPKKGE